MTQHNNWPEITEEELNTLVELVHQLKKKEHPLYERMAQDSFATAPPMVQALDENLFNTIFDMAFHLGVAAEKSQPMSMES